MDCALLPGIRVDIVFALDVRGDLVPAVGMARGLTIPALCPPFDNTKVTSASVKAWIL